MVTIVMIGTTVIASYMVMLAIIVIVPVAIIVIMVTVTLVILQHACQHAGCLQDVCLLLVAQLIDLKVLRCCI